MHILPEERHWVRCLKNKNHIYLRYKFIHLYLASYGLSQQFFKEPLHCLPFSQRKASFCEQGVDCFHMEKTVKPLKIADSQIVVIES